MQEKDIDLSDIDLKLYTKSYPTDASFVLIGMWGAKVEYMIEGVGWRIIEEMLKHQDSWTSVYIQSQMNMLYDLSKNFPDQFDCKVDLPTKV